MGGLFKKIARRVLAGLSAVVIVLALALGAFRLLIAQLPSYQSELKAWVADELDLDVEFDELDARLSLAGPELTLHGASIGVRGGGRTFLDASEARVAIDPWGLLLKWRVGVSRLTLDGVRLTVERTSDGGLRLAGASAESSLDLSELVPEEVEVVVRDSQLLYIDLARRRSWQFLGVAVTLDRSPSRLAVSARAQAPAELAENVEIRLVGEIADDATAETWQLTSELTNIDLGALARLAPTQKIVDVGGTGDLSISLAWSGNVVSRAEARVDLANVALGAWSDGGNELFDHIALGADWSRVDERTWDLALDGVEIVRDGRAWTPGGAHFVLEQDGDEVRRVELSSDFVRLDDLGPLVGALGDARVDDLWAGLDPRGDLEHVEASIERDGEGWDYAFSSHFEGMAFDRMKRFPGIEGLSGEIRADSRSGTVELENGETVLDWPAIFRTEIGANSLEGTVVWRRGRDGVRVIGNDLDADVLGQDLTSSFELSLPADGTSPHLDLEARLESVDLIAAKRFLPTPYMPDAVVKWLDEAILGGDGNNVELHFYGPVAAFPFDGGEGQFSVSADISDATLAFVEDWPLAEDLNGRIEFVNASFRATGTGHVLNSTTNDIEVGIADMREGILTVSTDAQGPLADVLQFAHEAPVIARHLGSGFERLHADAGQGATEVDLSLPLLNLDDYALDAALTMSDGALSIDGFGASATEINGRLRIDGASVSADSIEAVFLGGPVTASVGEPELPGYRSMISVEGETAASSILDSFDLPFEDLFGGQTRWSGRLLLPSTSMPAAPPMRVDVESNLSGIVMRFPQPLTKSASEPTNLQIAFVFDPDRLEVDGNLGATRRFVLDYAMNGDHFHFRRGGVAFGGGEPSLPALAGIYVEGRLPELDLNEWFALSKTTNIDQARPLFLGADLDVAEFRAFGQHLGSTSLEVNRLDRVWVVDVDSEAISGRITVPQDLSLREQILAEMERVYLDAGESVGLEADPRELPGLRLRAAEFGFGTRQLGRVEADVVADPSGLRLASFSSQSPSYSAEGSGSWLDGPGTSVSRAAVTISSSDVAATLDEFGLDPAVAGELADITASVYWEGAPSSSWLDHLNGDVSLHIETGTLVDIDPGAGRVVGLMSIAALPRRLALDFRDVFKEGLAFDDITGNFKIIDGNAYTNDLLMTGPTAEVGVIGRTGLRDRDYQQQAVVTAEPGKVLPTVGAVLGGVGVGAVLLIFTQIFKEKLKGIGRASYCVTGPWDAPVVDRLSKDERDRAASCVELPPEMTEVRDE